MTRAKLLMSLALAGMIGLCWVGTIVAQQAPPPPREGDRPDAERRERRRPSPEEMKQRIEQWRKRMSDQQRQQLGATEDEWKVLQPRIAKVQSLQREMRGGMFRMFSGRSMFGRRGDRGDRGGRDRRDANSSEERRRPTPMNPDGTPRELSKIEKTTMALRDVLGNKDASGAQITEALANLRAARSAKQQELAQARKELQEIVIPKQEAQLVMMGILE